MDTSTICAVLLAALITLSLPISHLELIVYPRDTEVLINHSAYFNCSTSIRNEQIHWYHYRVRENRTNYVYYKGEFNKNYPNRYSVMINKETGEYNLIISSVQPMDAGRYVCQDDGGLGRSSSAELIVLDSIPVCQSNTKSDGLVGPNSCGIPIDELRLSCIVSYSGNIPPILQWKMDGNEAPILRGITTDHSRNRVTMNLTRSSEVEIGHVLFTCGTTRSLKKQYSCTSEKVKVNYAFDEPAILNITKGENVTCSANASVPCTYRWFYGNDTLCPASCNQVLTTTRLEDHSCEASCTINGIRCTFVAMRLFVDESPPKSESTIKTLLVAILISTAIVLLVISIVLLLRYRKVRVTNKKLIHENSVWRQKTIMQSTCRGQEYIKPTTAYDVNHGVEMQDLLADDTGIIIHCTKEQEIITKASKEMGKTIAGVAILQDLIYVVSDQSSEVETFNLKTLKFKSCSNVKELVNPWDLASCKRNKRLYIMDSGSATDPSYVTCVNSDVKFLAKWPTGTEYGNLSVTTDGRVVVTVCDSRKLVIYNPDGTRMKVVSLSKDIIHPSHAIELSNEEFLISYGLNDDNVHRICITDKDNEIAKNSFSRMESPSYLAVDETGSIFVADQGNSRVCVFDSNLELKGEMASKIFELRCPHRICLAGKPGKLIVADNDLKNFKRRKGKLLIFKYKL